MARGLLRLVGLAGTLLVALPIAVLGLDLVVGGQPARGAVLLAVAGLVVVLGERVPTVQDLPERALGRVARWLQPEDSDDETDRD